ncbi:MULTISPECIES: patatin-like phospholipase family protein [Sphingobacterium]|uniref:patatin-like phospholipase family protein n=1 Tax=Sphingobacterium TaxID=28453 RepID=UPI00257A3E8F|nr:MULTISPECIES: patatin-like phospholipase family protein [Sphingobacterium]
MAYQRAVLFSGGGTRFSLYLGMYAALDELGLKPDLLIASCGGSMAVAVIQAFATHEARKCYLQSEEFYRFFLHHRLTEQRRLGKLGVYVLKKQLNEKRAPFIEDVFNRYLADMEQDLSLLLPTLDRPFSVAIPALVVGAKMLFSPSEVGQRRGDRKLYQKMLMGTKDVLANVPIEAIGIADENYVHSAVAEEVRLSAEFSVLQAARISMSDMFYIEPVCSNNTHYAGGAIDLVPMELANVLAENIICERKQPYKPQEEALVRAVLGFSGNKRLADLEQHFPYAHWIDTQDAAKQLAGKYCKKGIDWRKFEVTLSFPRDLEEFAEAMEAQWSYGYQVTLNSFKK